MHTKGTNILKPLILRDGEYSYGDIETLRETYPVTETIDLYEAQSSEVFDVLFPPLRFDPVRNQEFSEFLTKRHSKSAEGDWIYFPWSQKLLHTVCETELLLLRTNRNKNIINNEEQRLLSDCVVGIVGLSIGNSIATSLAYSGIGRTMKLAEFDDIETTNLNRIRAGLQTVGSPKLQVASEEIYEIDPHINLLTIPNGLTKENLAEFLGKPAPRFVFEAIDDFEMKVRLRIAACSAGIPVIMLTNLGDSILIDVERYDLNRTLPIFNGLIGNVSEEILSKPISEADKQKYAVEIVGKENVPRRAIESLSEIGETLIGRPQLMSTVTVSGGIAAYLARRIILGEPLPSGRKLIRFDEVFLP